LLIGEGLPQGAAVRISEALLPGDMVALIEGGERSLDAARRAIQWAADVNVKTIWINDAGGGHAESRTEWRPGES